MRIDSKYSTLLNAMIMTRLPKYLWLPCLLLAALFVACTSTDVDGSDVGQSPDSNASEADTADDADDVNDDAHDGGDIPNGDQFSWAQEPLDIPGVSYHTFESTAVDDTVGIHVFAPQPYHAQTDQVFPVLYWLHGSLGGRGGIEPLTQLFSYAMREGYVSPFLIVFLDAPPFSLWLDAYDGSANVEELYITELVPFIDAEFRTIASPEGRYVEGFSMGGYGALRYAFLYPDIFGAASSLAAGPLSPDFSDTPAVDEERRQAILDQLFGGDIQGYIDASPWTLAETEFDRFNGEVDLRLVMGELDATRANKEDFHEHLVQLDVDHDFFLIPDVGHQPVALHQGLGEDRWTFYP